MEGFCAIERCGESQPVGRCLWKLVEDGWGRVRAAESSGAGTGVHRLCSWPPPLSPSITTVISYYLLVALYDYLQVMYPV